MNRGGASFQALKGDGVSKRALGQTSMSQTNRKNVAGRDKISF